MNAVNKFLFVLCTLLIYGVTNVWAGDNPIKGTIGVGKGKGTVQVEVWTYKLLSDDTNDEQKEVSNGGGTVTINATATSNNNPLKRVYRYFRFWAKSPHAGYQFEAWYTNEACTEGRTTNTGSDYYQTTTSTDAQTYKFYAKFNPISYDVTLKANGGTGSDQVVSATYDSNMPGKLKDSNTAISKPTKTGYTFTGYYDAQSGGNKYYNSDLSSAKVWDKTAATTLYAHWTPNTYTVTLKPNGGAPNTDQTVTATYDAAMPTGSIASRTKTGYTFAGYYDAKTDGTQYYNANLESAKNWDKTHSASLYAHWTANTYTIAYNANGGTGTTNSSSHTYDVAKTLTTNGFSRTGYSFAGWSTSPTGSVEYTNGQSVVNLSATQGATVTLYAIWTAINYTVYLDNQGATTPGTEIVEVTYDSNVNLTSGITPPTKTNCTFEGYYTDPGCIETKRIDKNGAWQEADGFIVGGKWNCASDVTLYAYWMQNQTITWDFVENVEYTTGTEFNATASSGLDVYYTSSNEDIAKIVDGNKLLVVTPNAEVTIIAHQDGNHDWNAAPTVERKIRTLGATPNDTSAVSAKDITYGQTLSESVLSGAVKVNGITIPGTLTWLEPTTLPNAGANQPFAVRFTPDNLAAYSAIEFYVKVNVGKATPVFTWNISNILRENVRYSNFVTSTNKESAISSQVDAAHTQYVTTSGVTLTTREVDDVVNNITIIVMQGATDNFVAKNETLTVSIYPKSESCLPFNPMTGDDFNNKTISGTNGNVEWYNTNDNGHRENYILWFDVTYTQRVGIGLGSWEAGLSGISVAGLTYLINTGKFKYDDKSVDLSFSGIPDRISFDVESQTVTSTPPEATWPATAPQWALYQSVDGKNYGDPIASREGDGSISYQFTNENVRFVRIEYTGNFTGFVKNLRISHKKSLTTDKSSLTFGTEDHPLQEPQTIKVSYSSLGVCGGLDDAITVTSSNPAFYVDETTITENVGLELKGEYTVRVRCNDVNQTGKIVFESNDGTKLEVPVSSTKPAISASTAATKIFQTGTEHAPVAETAYRALRTHNFSACFDDKGNAIFDALYIYGVSESSAADRQWSYDASKGYNVPTISASNVHTPCFVYKKDGKQYTYDHTFDASTETLNIADGKKHIFVGYKPECSAATAIQVNGANTELYLNNTEIIASGAPLAINATSAVYANGVNIISSTGNAAVQLSGATTLTVEDTWTGDATSAILALRPATSYPSIDLGSASGRVNVNGTQLTLRNATNMAIAHMEGTTEHFDGEVHINDGSIGGEDTLGMPKRTFIDGGTFNDGTVAAYTLKGMPKRPRNSRGEMLSRHTMSKDALASAYSWYGQAHLTQDGASKVNPMLMDEVVWIFTGDAGESYDEADSWNKDGVPGENDDVLINAPMVIAGGEMKLHGITINWVDGEHGVPAITVKPDAGLTVGEDGVDGATEGNLALEADTVHDSATKGQTGFLRIHPNSAEPMPEATVELFSTAYYDMTVSNHNQTGEWQFVGYPMRDGAAAKTVFSKSFLYDWDSSSSAWVNNRKNCVLKPFQGYATSQYKNVNGWLTTFSGVLVENKDTIINLAYNEGSEFTYNMLANSYSAPIDIAHFDDKDFNGIQAAVYIFNTGSREDIKNLGEMRSGSCNIPGQYLTIPIGSARDMKEAFLTPTIIAPMQGFYVHATDSNAFIRLNYDSLVWKATNKNAPLHAPVRKAREQVGSLCVSLYGEGVADNLYILESDKYDVAFENGYDAKKMNSGEANIFAVEGDQQLAVDATNNIVGTHIGVRAGETTTYTMGFSHMSSEHDLLLFDAETTELLGIYEGLEYTFNVEPNTTVTDRFIILEREKTPEVTTVIENAAANSVKVKKFIKDNQLYILKNGVLYNATGARVH